jgi:hypothetical protein
LSSVLLSVAPIAAASFGSKSDRACADSRSRPAAPSLWQAAQLAEAGGCPASAWQVKHAAWVRGTVLNVPFLSQ